MWDRARQLIFGGALCALLLPATVAAQQGPDAFVGLWSGYDSTGTPSYLSITKATGDATIDVAMGLATLEDVAETVTRYLVRSESPDTSFLIDTAHSTTLVVHWHGAGGIGIEWPNGRAGMFVRSHWLVPPAAAGYARDVQARILSLTGYWFDTVGRRHEVQVTDPAAGVLVWTVGAEGETVSPTPPTRVRGVNGAAMELEDGRTLVWLSNTELSVRSGGDELRRLRRRP